MRKVYLNGALLLVVYFLFLACNEQITAPRKKDTVDLLVSFFHTEASSIYENLQSYTLRINDEIVFHVQFTQPGDGVLMEHIVRNVQMPETWKQYSVEIYGPDAFMTIYVL